MVAGHLREKRGIWHMVLEYKDETGKRKTISRSTGLPTKGNKKKAEQMLLELRKEYDFLETGVKTAEITFADFLADWLNNIKRNVSGNTYSNYNYTVSHRMIPYFKGTGVLLQELKPINIQKFYEYVQNTYHVKNNTLLRYHSILHSALQFAEKMDFILINPMNRVERPKKEVYIGQTYTDEEIRLLLQAVKGDILELAVILGAYYGLRREEILGLQWESIDFENNTITIQHTAVVYPVEGRRKIVIEKKTKTKSSYRTLPMTNSLKEILMERKKLQEYWQEFAGGSYCQDYLGCVYVDQLGNLVKPDYLSKRFTKILEKNNLRKIRFHDLRHCCASFLYAHNNNIKEIQEWLGHGDISTTMDIYTHLSYRTKENIAHSIEDAMSHSSLVPK